jgi:integrase
MPRPRTGQIKRRNGKFIARIRWKDATGKQREKWRTAATRTEARNLIRLLWSEVEQERLEQQHTAAPAPEQPRTFADLAEAYFAERVTPPVYVGDRKVAGMRAHANIRNEVTPLRNHFGPRPITEITYAEIKQYKRLHLAIEKKHGGQRTLADFNHELRRLRAMFNFAIQKQWLLANPEALVFGGIKSDAVTHLFAKVCRAAGISDLHFHDLRHWATTDIVNALTAAGIAPQHAMAITGHSQEKTFRRYLRTDNSTVKAAGAALDALKTAKSNAKREQKRGQVQSEDPKKSAPVSKLRRIK